MDPGVHLGVALCNKDLPECRDYINMAIGSFACSAEPWDANSNPLPESVLCGEWECLALVAACEKTRGRFYSIGISTSNGRSKVRSSMIGQVPRRLRRAVCAYLRFKLAGGKQ